MSRVPPLIPLEVLLGNPTFIRPALSPDGAWLAWIAPHDGVQNVWLRAVGGGEARPLTRDTGRGIRVFQWAHDGAHLLYLQDRDGDENWHVYAVRTDDGSVRDLTPYPGVQAQIVGVEPSCPGMVLLGLNHPNPTAHNVCAADLVSGTLALDTENPGDVVGWVADARLQVRGALAQTAEGGWDIRAREPGGAWTSLHTVGPEDEAAPLAFTEDGRGLYISTTRGFNTQRIVLLNLDTNAMRDVAGRDDVDAGTRVFHPTRRHLQAVAFERHRREWLLLDEDIRPMWDAARAASDGDMYLTSRTDDDTRWTVGFTRDTGSDPYFLVQRTNGGPPAVSYLFAQRPDMEAYTLAPMRPVDITARDGLTLPCYLTLPVGAEPGPLPMVLVVHGGPWQRDAWGYDPEGQWLANRGYACLQVNYRGSAGFGKAFLHAGDREWGGKMLDDLIDAVEWAIGEGIAQRDRVGIFGGSYGGYAVLCGLAFRPQVFACGVDIVGVSSLLTFLNSIPPYWEPFRKILEDRVGRLGEDDEFLKSRSPLFHVHRMERPLLIAQGANDPRVVQSQSEQMVDALRAAGKPVEYMLFPDEGHGFARPHNRLRFYAAADRFLARYLGGRAES